MKNGEEKWIFHKAYHHDLPSDEHLKTLRTVIIPGSGHAVYNANVSWIPEVKDFIRRVITEYPHIKIIGGCFGEQITAAAMGGKVEKMPYNPERPKCLGREHIQFTDEFFE